MARTSAKPRTVAMDVHRVPRGHQRQWSWPWYVTAGFGPIAVLLAMWLVLGGLAAIGWLTSPDATLPGALALASKMLLLANGAPVEIGGLPVGIAPLGLSTLLILLSLPITSFAARQAAGSRVGASGTDRLRPGREVVVWRVAGLFASVYAVGMSVIAAVNQTLSFSGVAGSLAIGIVAGLLGAARGLGYDPTAAWPESLRVVPRAAGAALLALLAGGAVLLTVALLASRDQISVIAEGLGGGPTATFLLIALHLAYLPNFILVCISWLLGAGFTLGDGSVVTMLTSDVGLLPAIPILGAVPGPDFGSPANYWWFGVGIVSGAVAALVVALTLPGSRFDRTALIGGGSGLLAGGLVVVACALGSGSLGLERLALVGARVTALVMFAPTILGLSGMAFGLLFGLLMRRRHPVEAVGLGQ